MGQARWQIPDTALLAIKDTPTIGRAVFAKTDLSSDTLLLSTFEPLSPLCHVILRPYRKEVCAQCFRYDRGQEWKIKVAALGIAFCSSRCKDAWYQENDETCQTAFAAVETFIKTSHQRRSRSGKEKNGLNEVEKTSVVDDDGIVNEWKEVERLGESVLRAKLSKDPSKLHRTVLRNTKDLTTDPDILTYTLSGVLALYRAGGLRGFDHDNVAASNTGPTRNIAADFLPSIYQLVPDDTVFINTPVTLSPLEDYTSAYLILLAILPTSLLPLVTSDLIINLASRASHNAFSIRPEGSTDGDQSGEFLGWGVWPEASFFNHSCRPNVSKERKGRIWMFSTNTGLETVTAGEQLCITYLGGDEKDLNVQERRTRLQEQWGFLCQCTLCKEESDQV